MSYRPVEITVGVSPLGPTFGRQGGEWEGLTVASDERELSHSAALAAHQIRKVQTSFADEDPGKRREFIEEVVNRSIEAVVPDLRVAFLRALEEEFPVWDGGGAPAPVSVPPEEAAAKSPPHILADLLVEAAEFMDDEGRRKLSARLAEGGLAPAPGALPSPSAPSAASDLMLPKRTEEAAQFLMGKLGVDHVDLTRALKLLWLVMEYMGSTDQVVWNTWKTVAPRSAMRRSSDLRQDMSRYISGERGVSGSQLKGHVEKLRRLTASMIAAMGQVGPLLTRDCLGKFDPEEIETQVAREGGGLLASREAKCWSKFTELARDLREENVEHMIKEIIERCTESLMAKSGGGQDKPVDTTHEEGA